MNSFCEKITSGYRPNFQEIVDELGGLFPMLYDLEDTPQDTDWHAEGNVHIHTSMALDALYGLIDIEGKDLDEDQILTLVLAVALHDIAKPTCTKPIEIKWIERIAAPKHEYKGACYIAYRLADLGLPFSIVHKIISLVAYHIMPKLLVVKGADAFQYKKLARSTDMQLLYFLEKADMIGRTCADQKEQIEYIDLFKLFSIEHKAWLTTTPYTEWKKVIDNELASFPEQTRKFVLSRTISDAEDGVIHSVEEGIARSFSYRDDFSELIILCGPSGAGKSTWIRNNLPDFEVVSMDQLRKEITGKQSDQKKNGQVLQAAKKLLKVHLAKKKKVVWDATSLRKDFRKQIVDLGLDYNAFVTIAWFYGPCSYFVTQNKSRQTEIPESVLLKQLDSLEWPEPAEAHNYMVLGEKGVLLLD